MKSLRSRVMGVVNVTPDSFYDGGRHNTLDQAYKQALQLITDGADIIDIGGESSRPGAERVSEAEEMRRVVPLIQRLKKETDITISIDTYKANVAREAVCAGAQVVNDISGLTFKEEAVTMAKVVAQTGVTYVLTHIQGTPKHMQVNPVYEDVVSDIRDFFVKKTGFLRSHGVIFDQVVLDPGIGFGKTLEHNLEILKNLDHFMKLEMPIMIGTSRKSFIGKIQKDDGPDARLAGSLASAVYAYLKGVTYFRVHDVLETRRALSVVEAINKVS